MKETRTWKFNQTGGEGVSYFPSDINTFGFKGSYTPRDETSVETKAEESSSSGLKSRKREPSDYRKWEKPRDITLFACPISRTTKYNIPSL